MKTKVKQFFAACLAIYRHLARKRVAASALIALSTTGCFITDSNDDFTFGLEHFHFLIKNAPNKEVVTAYLEALLLDKTTRSIALTDNLVFLDSLISRFSKIHNI